MDTIRHRDANSLLGRWAEQDPAEYIDGANRYSRLGSSPTRYSDPSALAVVTSYTGMKLAEPMGELYKLMLTEIEQIPLFEAFDEKAGGFLTRLADKFVTDTVTDYRKEVGDYMLRDHTYWDDCCRTWKFHDPYSKPEIVGTANTTEIEIIKGLKITAAKPTVVFAAPMEENTIKHTSVEWTYEIHAASDFQLPGPLNLLKYMPKDRIVHFTTEEDLVATGDWHA